MRTNVWASVGESTLPKCLLFLITILLIISPVMGATLSNVLNPTDTLIVNSTTRLSNETAIPFSMWIGAIILGLVLVVISFMSVLFKDGEEGLVSIFAWIPIAYALYSSFAVDVKSSTGMVGSGGDYVILESHTIYHFDVVALCLLILLVFAIGNTYRIWVSQKRLRELSEGEM